MVGHYCGVTEAYRTGDCKVTGSTLAQCTTRQQPWASCSCTCVFVH